MSASLNLLSMLQAGAARTVLGCAQSVATAAYYFFGYWFSHRLA
jgi:hypothetical protein